MATDVLARGIDVPDVDHVINFDLPDMPEDYVHRIGRTGRAGEQGYAISFVTRESSRTLRDIEKLIGKDIPFMELESYELSMSVLEKPKKGSGARNSGPKSNRSYGNSRPSGNRDGKRPSGNRSEGKSFGGNRSQDNRPGRSSRPDGKRSETPKREGGFSRAGSSEGSKREGVSKNYSNAAKRVSSSKKADVQASAKPKKQRSKHSKPSTYDYSRFA